MDEVWKRDEIDSPCVNICVMHRKAEICIGCYRTIDEISKWSVMNTRERKTLVRELPSRAGLLVGKRGQARRSRRDKANKI
ncbi:MAG: DUF1289 domain-containing protein [Rhodobacteraceae bacterium]|nr:DUF1289 domain-containing protein [Paracoccaceae bacterium]